MKTTITLSRSMLKIIVSNKPVTVLGEALLRKYGSPIDFVVFKNTINKWDNGEIIDEQQREEIIKAILTEGEQRGFKIEIE